MAIEVPRPTELELLEEVLSFSSFLAIFLILILGSGTLWFMTNKYFDMIKQQISDTMENNFMSLSGEEKVWEKFTPPAPSVGQDLAKEALGLEPSLPAPAKEAATQVVKPIDEREALLVKKPKVALKEEALPKLSEPKGTESEASSLDQLTINVNNVKSPILKRIIQQFRQK